MSAHFEIPTWANGPDGSANGGYAAGCIADACGMHSGAVEVSLRLPPPLAAPLTAHWSDEDDRWTVVDFDDAHVATARRTDLSDLDIPEGSLAISAQQATQASSRFPYATSHPFPRCLCCGTARAADVPSLNIHCGQVEDTTFYADVWTPNADLADPDAPVLASRLACFSALDCPSASPFADPAKAAVLARFEVELDEQPRIDDRCVLVAWELGRDGRKLSSASVLLGTDGRLLGRARALWIEVRSA